MNLWSISFAYRLGLGFHALNNEGADGSNLMQPRRIDVGRATYDGISGEMIRRHILANFVRRCNAENIPVLPMSEGLHPDRGPLGIRHAARDLNHDRLEAQNLYESVRQAIRSCAVLDVGGYLAAWREQPQNYTAERAYIQNNCAAPETEDQSRRVDPVKRDSCFDVAWLISEAPQDLTVTQHSAYRDSPGLNSRYAQTMRSNVYGGVARAELHRVGTDDYWYLQPGRGRLAVDQAEQLRRQTILTHAIAEYIAAPTGAKMAGWSPHCFLIEGAIVLCASRTAPFESPIRVDLRDESTPVGPNGDYAATMTALANGKDTWAWTFSNAKTLLESAAEATMLLAGKSSR